jgi:hypothetical protein
MYLPIYLTTTTTTGAAYLAPPTLVWYHDKYLHQENRSQAVQIYLSLEFPHPLIPHQPGWENPSAERSASREVTRQTKGLGSRY